jgi:hypothetical protein
MAESPACHSGAVGHTSGTMIKSPSPAAVPGSVSRPELQANLSVSMLRRYIEAIGGRLEIHAVFPGLDVELRLDDCDALDRDNPDDDSERREAL